MRTPERQRASGVRSGSGPFPRPLVFFLPFLAVGLALAGCAQAPPPVTPVSADFPPWLLPAEEMRTQRLLRAHYEGPEGEGGFRITFRLDTVRRYQALASLAVGGRKLWSLDVDGPDGLWIDHRARTYCRLDRRLELAGGLLSSLPFEAFPALLLGRVPEPPAASPKRRGGTLTFRGGDQRRWRVETEGGRVLRWTLWEGQRPVTWWELRGPEAILSDRRRGVQLRWREVVRESLAGELEPLPVPEGYRLGECRSLELEIPADPSPDAPGAPGRAPGGS